MSKVIMLSLLACITPICAIAGELTGAASYRERISLPAEAQFRAILYEISNNDQVEIGRYQAKGDSGPPYRFKITYDDNAISNDGRYALRAEVIWQDRPYFLAGEVLENFANNQQPAIQLTMVRPSVKTSDTKIKPLQAAQVMNPRVLSLPATFRGITKDSEIQTDWYLSLWPDQSFQLLRNFSDGADKSFTRSSLGRWEVGPTDNILILRDGAEMPLMIRALDNNRLEVIDSNTDVALAGVLKSDGKLEPARLNGMLISGMMIYQADAAVLEECMSGMRFPIVQDLDYFSLEKAYLAGRSAPGTPLYVLIEGGISKQTGMEGPARQMVTVERFVQTRSDVTCERQRANASLQNTFWRLVELNSEPLPMIEFRREPHILFESGTEAGFRATLGCNQMRGGVTIDKSKLSFSPGATTLMACPDPLNKLEQEFNQMLALVTEFAIRGETLVLSDAKGAPLAVFMAIYF